MTVPFMYYFRIPYDFLKIDFSHFTAQVRLFSVLKWKSKILGIKNVVERGIRKILASVIRLNGWFTRRDSFQNGIIRANTKFQEDINCESKGICL